MMGCSQLTAFHIFTTVAGVSGAAYLMDGALTLLPYFAGSVIASTLLTPWSKTWRSDLSYWASGVLVGTVCGLSASRIPQVAWIAELIAVFGAVAGPLILTSVRENPAAAFKMLLSGALQVRQVFFGGHGKYIPPPNPATKGEDET